MKKTSDFKALANLIFEAGDLKRIARSGWWHAKIKQPETVAEHSFRTALIAYILAKLETHPSPEKIAFLALIHDLPESRLLDLHKISSHYVENKKQLEERILEDQRRSSGMQFPEPSAGDALLVKDADLLELAFTAKEYMESGHPQAKHFLVGAGAKLKSPSSKQLFSALKNTPSSEWWEKLV